MNRMDYFEKRPTLFIQDVEIVDTAYKTDYSYIVLEKTAYLELRNKNLMENTEELHKLLHEAEDAQYKDHKEIVYLKGEIKSLQKSLENKTSIEDELEDMKDYQDEQKEKIARLEYENKKMKKEIQKMSSNAEHLTDEIGKLNQEKLKDNDTMKRLNAHIKIVEEELLKSEQTIQKMEASFSKTDGKACELTKYVHELNRIIENLHESKKTLQEKLDDTEGEIALLRQQNLHNNSHFTVPRNSLMYEIREREKATLEEMKACMPSQILNTEDSTQLLEDETSSQEESRNVFDPKMLGSSKSFYLRLQATMVAVLLIIAVLLSIYISSVPSCKVHSEIQLFQLSLPSFLEQVIWDYWGICHLELPPQ